MGEALRDSTTEGMNDSRAYCEHLFDATTDGYITIVELDNSSGVKVPKTHNMKLKDLKAFVEETKGRKDIYISPNTYIYPRRSAGNIRQYRSLFIDLDVEKYGKHTKEETLEILKSLASENKIPEPSMITDSGRGFHVYFVIKNAPKQALQAFQELEDYLYYQMKDLGADLCATDSARVLRLPGTINSRNNAMCKVVYINNGIEYSMYELRDKYLHFQEVRQKRAAEAKEPRVKKVCTVRKLITTYNLHYTRAEDIKTLCKLRGYDVEGSRDLIIHCFSYWTGIFVRDQERLLQEVMELNSKFKKPLPDGEMKGICKTVEKAIEKFIDYEQGIRSGLVKRVTKGMRDKPGYWYTNVTLIEKLQITAAEQEKLKTIIGIDEKYCRRNVKRNASRRNANGLTDRQQAKQDLFEKLTDLKKYNPKMSNQELSKILGVTKQYVGQLLGVN